MIEMRRAQRSFGDGLIAAEIGDLREPWMTRADAVLADEGLVGEQLTLRPLLFARNLRT
jgi:IS5 family transposase